MSIFCGKMTSTRAERPQLKKLLATLQCRRLIERTARSRSKTKGVCSGRKPKLTLHYARDAQQHLAESNAQCKLSGSYNVIDSTRFSLASK